MTSLTLLSVIFHIVDCDCWVICLSFCFKLNSGVKAANTTGLKHDSSTGAKTDVINRATDASGPFPSFRKAKTMQAIIEVLLRKFPKFVIRIFILLLAEMAFDLASSANVFFLMLRRCRIVRSDVKIERI